MNTTDTTVLARLQGVTRKFGKTEALRGLSFDIERGSVTALAGPNGAGKSTTLKLLCGLIGYKGSAVLNGREIGSMTDPELANATFFLPEDKELRGASKVKDILKEAAALGGSRVDSAKLIGLVTELSVAPYLERRVRELSPGIRTALYLAVMLSTSAELYALDEPLSNLDPLLRTKVIGRMKELAIREGKTILYSTHILEEAEEAADRVVFMDHGRVLHSGGTDEAKERFRELVADGRDAETLTSGTPGVLHVRRENDGVLRALVDLSLAKENLPGKTWPVSLRDLFLHLVEASRERGNA